MVPQVALAKGALLLLCIRFLGPLPPPSSSGFAINAKGSPKVPQVPQHDLLLEWIVAIRGNPIVRRPFRVPQGSPA